MRADHLGSYGHAAAETPRLDALARSGLRFEKATTVVPLTPPAHASLLTGTFPAWHGVRDRPFFAWVHLYDPHTPYEAPEPFRSRFPGTAQGAYDAEIAYTDSQVRALRAGGGRPLRRAPGDPGPPAAGRRAPSTASSRRAWPLSASIS